MRQTVVFIDGPSGAGKDFFVDNLVKLHRKHSSWFSRKPPVKVIRSTDVVMDSVTETENRKYTAYGTPVDKQQMLYEGHVKLLRHIKQVLSVPNPPELVLVNRSFLSFINYNTYESIIRSKYLADYCKDYAETMGDIYTVLVNLGVSSEDVLLSRIRSRNDDKPINENWITTIHARYQDTPDELKHQFDFYVPTDSGGYSEFYDSYLAD